MTIADSGGTSGYDELYVYGTDNPDHFILRAGTSTDITAGIIIAGQESDNHHDLVNYRQVERVTINSLGGDDSFLSDDTAVITVINMGPGNDSITVGTVPQKPDTGNRTAEFPDGVPVADTEHMTNGNSATLLVNGGDGQDQFEVNHNRAQALSERRQRATTFS